MNVRNLVVEGWRTSNHSYALVNQHQLLQLLADRRFQLWHVDLPFHLPHWAQLDGGFSALEKARLAQLQPPACAHADLIYRISWPLRMHGGAADRIFVFGTCELQRFEARAFCGPTGNVEGIDPQAVEIITPSHWSRAGFLAAGFREERVHVVAHGVDVARFAGAEPGERASVRAALGISAEQFVFLNVGAMTWNKGIGPLLAAFARYRREDDRALLVLKGGDALYGNLLKSALEEAAVLDPTFSPSRLQAALRYLPHSLKQTDLARLFRACDAYVSPYRAEGFNIPVLEALAAGIVPIVTAGGATDDFCPETLCVRIAAVRRSSARGNFLEPDLDSLVAGMRRSASETGLQRTVAGAGPAWVAEGYSWNRVTVKLADLFARSS